MAKKSTTDVKQKASLKKVKTGAVDTTSLDKAVKNLVRLAGAASPEAAIVGANTDLTDDDLLCVYSITITDKDGNKIVTNKGSTTLSGISDPGALPESPQILETVFRAIIWRPIRNRFMKWLNERVESNRVLPELPGAMEDDVAMIAPVGALSD